MTTGQGLATLAGPLPDRIESSVAFQIHLPERQRIAFVRPVAEVPPLAAADVACARVQFCRRQFFEDFQDGFVLRRHRVSYNSAAMRNMF
jgi:hypothetical protein